MNIKLKEFVRSLVHLTSIYRRTRRSLEGTFTMDKLEVAVRKAVADVPYYRAQGYAAMLEGKDFDLSLLPVISKATVIGHEAEFVSSRFFKFLLRKEKTGGTTGVPMKLFYSPTLSIQRTVMPDILYDRFTSRDMQIAMLRGVRPHNNAIYERIGPQKIAMSSYLINEGNVDDYLNVLCDENISIMTVFPSSISVLASHIEKVHGVCPSTPLKVIFASSEVFDRTSKELVMRVFPGVEVVDYYCMSEFVTAAYSVGLGNYIFNNNYGYVELLDTGETAPNGNHICRIVATSIMNDTMPLIRYDTGDLVERDAHNNIVSIIGRVNHYAVNKNSELVPCIVIFSDTPMLHTLQYQYYQDTPGVLEIRVLPKSDFTQQDRLTMEKNMEDCFQDTMECRVVTVDSIPRTKAGKLKRMEQRLDLNQYR